LSSVDKRLRFLLLAVLTLLAGWLRFSAIGFGLPDQLRPDEELLVPTALGFEHDWNPHMAIYPAAQTYLVHGVLRSYATLTRARLNLHAAYGQDNGARAFLIARQVSAAMGTATVPLIFLAAAPVYGPGAALTAAAIVTVSYIHVRESKFAKVEVPAGFWLALSILMTLRISYRGHWLDYALAGLFCGLAAATHYTAGAIAIGIVVAHLESRRREGQILLGALADRRIYIAGIVTIAAFIAADPYFILDWHRTLDTYSNLRHDYNMWNGGHTPAGFGWPWLILRAMPAGLGLALEVFLLAALPWIVFRPRPGTFALLAFVIACFLSLTGGHPQLEFRYLVNPLLAMALLGGVFAADLAAMACSSIGSRAGGVVAVLVGTLLIIPSILRDLQLNDLLRQTDTRTIAEQWMINYIPSSTKVLVLRGDSYGKPKLPGRYKLISIPDLSTLKMTHGWATWVVTDSLPELELWSKGPTDAELEYLNAAGTLEFDVDSIKAGAAAPVFDPNDAFYVPFTHITSMLRPGPRIRIWKFAAATPTGLPMRALPSTGTRTL